MEFNHISRWLIIIGICFLAAGLIIWVISSFLGPRNILGTLRINIGGATIVFPIFLSIILSMVLTLILNLAAKFLNK